MLCCTDESMQKLFEGGKGSVFQRVLSWIPSHNHQLQLAGALAIANFARNGKLYSAVLSLRNLTDHWLASCVQTGFPTLLEKWDTV